MSGTYGVIIVRADAEILQVALESAYSCSPSVFSKRALDPAERSSLLLLDKDFLDSEGN